MPEHRRVTLGIGTMVKRDSVFVKVTTDDGLVGWGKSHHGRAHLAIAALVNTTLKGLVLGMDATDVNGVWSRIYKFQLASHGMGAACAMAMSGIDIALWDIRGKAVGWPIYKLLGGAARDIPAYAGGISLGYQPPASLVEEVGSFVTAGYKAVKLGWVTHGPRCRTRPRGTRFIQRRGHPGGCQCRLYGRGRAARRARV